MTDDAVRFVRSGDGQVAYRVVGSGPSVAWVPGTSAGAPTIVTVHEFRRVGRTPWSPFGRVGHRDAIEETWGRPKVDEAFAAGTRIFERESGNDLLAQPGTTAPDFERKPDGVQMPDSKLVMFGKPAVGAAVMLAAPLAALDIPLKVLVWEDRNGAVSVSYNSPGFLAGRHHLEGALRAPFDAVESIVEALFAA